MNTDNRYHWPHKDLLDVTQLSGEDVRHLLDLAASFQEINRRPVKKVPTLKGKTVVLFFVENSTRTKTSFDVAGKRLSADTYSLAKSGSSLNKGESLKDTALTLQAMGPDVIVIRHSSSGAAASSTAATAGTPIPPRPCWTASACARSGATTLPGAPC